VRFDAKHCQIMRNTQGRLFTQSALFILGFYYLDREKMFCNSIICHRLVHKRLPISFWLVLSVIVPSLVKAQTCLPEGFTFQHQEEIDQFPLQYPQCHEISGGVIIEGSDEDPIVNLSGLNQISSLGSFLEIRNNSQLHSLAGLENLLEIRGRLSITANHSLENIEALHTLNSVGESVRISANPALEKITVLNGLKIIRGDLSISDNSLLAEINGFSNLIEIDGSLLITSNATLSNLDSLTDLRKVRGNLFVRDNQMLHDLTGLDHLSQVLSDLIIENNRSLVSLKGLQSLNAVGRYLQIVNNDNIQNLSGLDSVKSIGGLLQIYNNSILQSLGGIDQIAEQSIDNLAIIACPQLNDCAVTSICNYLRASDDRHSISGNKLGCNGRAQILERCDRMGGNTTPAPNVILLSPNPTNAIVRIKGFEQDASFQVRDISGKLLIKDKLENNMVDLDGLPSALYLIELVSERRSIRRIIIKI